MAEQIESNENGDVAAASGMLSRRRALGLGAAVAGGVWVAPAILSFDAASAAPSGVGPTTTTGPAPTTTQPATTTTTEEPPTTTTTAAPRTITANVTGAVMYSQKPPSYLTNPTPVTVAVGQPIELVFTRPISNTPLQFVYGTYGGSAVPGTDYTASSGLGVFQVGETSTTITIQTIATGPGPNTSFTVTVDNDYDL